MASLELAAAATWLLSIPYKSETDLECAISRLTLATQLLCTEITVINGAQRLLIFYRLRFRESCQCVFIYKIVLWTLLVNSIKTIS